ncbi:sporulation integral membrane protein YtvI [Sutcliffiella halmapala]|uniref:sporulation integral membrane protein YtvI n=1 Tax=Sutcliffiella halmapala TaxID=79882 RepID=UPI001F1DC8CA|nr:sporulation integral membrane protein YtvI [Sutcliffiella halmapala]
MLNHALTKKILTICIVTAVSIFVYIYFSVFLPILLALLTAMVFEPFVKMIQRHLKMEKRIIPVSIVFSLFLVISVITVYFTFTKIIKSIYEWVLNVPQHALEIQRSIDAFIIKFNQLVEEIPQGYLIVRELHRQSEGLSDKAIQITSQFVAMLGSWLQVIPNLLFVTLIYLITLFLFSLDLPRLYNLFLNFFNPETSNKLRFVLHRMSNVFVGYWKAQFILSIGVFLITYISLFFISPDEAFIMSFIIWLVDIIPLYVGPALILVPWGIIAMILGDVNMGIQLFILAVGITVLRRIIEPKVLGDSIGLAALPTVLSMYFGFVFFGVMGLIFGPFVYIGILAIKEAGLFELGLTKKDKENGDADPNI